MLMAPPPLTPSPHRFVLNQTRKSRVTQPSPLASSQFNSTPRFSFAQSQRVAAISAQDASSKASLIAHSSSAARHRSEEQDTIQDLSQDFSESIQESIEAVEQFNSIEHAPIDRDDDDDELDGRQLKRRRLASSTGLDNQSQDFENGQQNESELKILESDHETLLYGHNSHDDHEDSLSNPDFSSPPATNRQQTASAYAPRFVIPSPAASASLSTPAPLEPTSFLRPPRFRPPDERNTEGAVSEPLPEAFSPHRRGQKYLPGGLAAELRAWIVGLESRGSWTGAREDQWLVKLLIDEVRGGPGAGMTFVSGRSMHRGSSDERYGDIEENSGTVKMILGGGVGTSTGMQKGKPAEIGKMIGVKGPVWEVLIEGARWGVAANWEVLN